MNTKSRSDSLVPTNIVHHQKSRSLEITFNNEDQFLLSCEYLRVYSPSAEVRGHGPGQEVLQIGKKEVNIRHIEAVGHYALKLTFTDGHDTGIYSWDYLWSLGKEYEVNWSEYLDRLKKAGATRD
ncbi:MAG: DUF971 domain-containing protein [Betaproteobacteria bacterium]|nr:DUF971 domain-containing protein [Betaproteobacteria bacterium]MDA9295568.1 DUF971 domain-containing protein [Burkholderiales bacterium]MBT5671534.1 DUF971 domain-containing protein [Betaproteobacteria bacterium]MBT6185123.1 DUF971 domain-containing protein [Betaproteobacteria bacterium]MBT6530153.1 DUF971 domain-containing protein [Betaproteobacteria bacterium]